MMDFLSFFLRGEREIVPDSVNSGGVELRQRGHVPPLRSLEVSYMKTNEQLETFCCFRW